MGDSQKGKLLNGCTSWALPTVIIVHRTVELSRRDKRSALVICSTSYLQSAHYG